MRVLCRDAEWLVTRVEASDSTNTEHAVHCIGADDLVRGHQSIFLTQLDTITAVDPRQTRLVQDSSSGYRLSKLFLEAQLRQMPATGVEPDLEGLGAFKPMKYQIDAVSLALKQLRPRLLLADSVGLGKTIQVGMILTELMRRGRADRILVLTKKSMLTQFQSELWNRFALPLVRLDSAGIAKLRLRIPANKNPFEVYHRVIISIDTLKNVGSYQHFLQKTHWDVVVIDEAHNVAGASVPERHLAYRLARVLSTKTHSMLLTTATPHNGKRETFGRLISLLDPSAIPDPQFREYTAEDVKGFFLMRFKEDVRDEAGDNLSERQVVPMAETTADAQPAEEKVYAILSELRRAITAKRDAEDRPAAWKNQALVQYGIYKLFLSSPEACRSTVESRLKRESVANPDSPELSYLKQMKQALAGLNLPESTRYQILKRQLKQMGWNGSADSPRVLIFTEYRHTQDALAFALARDFKLEVRRSTPSGAGDDSRRLPGRTPDENDRSVRNRVVEHAIVAGDRRGVGRNQPAPRMPQHHSLRSAVVDHHFDPAEWTDRPVRPAPLARAAVPGGEHSAGIAEGRLRDLPAAGGEGRRDQSLDQAGRIGAETLRPRGRGTLHRRTGDSAGQRSDPGDRCRVRRSRSGFAGSAAGRSLPG
jgi:hypothetical protein